MAGSRWVAGLALVVAVTTACTAADATAPAGSPAPTTTSADTPRPAVPRAAGTTAPDLSAAVARAVDGSAGVDLAVAVLDLTTDTAAGYRDDVPFHAASLSKLLVAVDVLTAGDLDDADRDRLHRALSDSDDEAMNDLWTGHDGIGAVDRVAGLAGLVDTHAPEDPSQWGDVETSADDLVRLYRYVLTELPEAARTFVVDALSSAPVTAADGFDQAFGLLAPGVDGYAKQGWMWYYPTDLYLHSAGVVADRYVVALLSVQSSISPDEARGHLDDITRSLLSTLVPGG
ncbi:serine hydrolase [Actinosynnema sp. NPDC047251]|uniref:Putative secreted protein n=1 Tax=Saccharothrix espanaensis (strain ATCC 51144 / DSM 44229 / JCM 9112 / NBRC 15066 / NRRL 15764) TaxID=1179773 RepID=K0JSI5_SACES|nr:serine hydrolase [Saccharothrix espanaensis]CCH28841.1 putative secreted protein [Saccharothrix espanaensis DSM 44229]